jgi:hypothetical protein
VINTLIVLLAGQLMYIIFILMGHERLEARENLINASLVKRE